MANLTGVAMDPNVRENTGGFSVVPAGKYHAVIVSDDFKDNKAGTGKLLELSVQITKGPHAGQDLLDRLNILNPSTVAQNIGQGTLKRICSVCDQPYPPDDTRKLWGIPMTITVGVEEFESNTSGKRLQSNKITAYNKVSELPAAEETKQPAVGGSW